jgi:hypothetical protein
LGLPAKTRDQLKLVPRRQKKSAIAGCGVDNHIAMMKPSTQPNGPQALPRENEPIESLAGDSLSGDSLNQLSHGELGLLQDITLSQMQSTHGATATLLFGRVWQRLETERRRRQSEIRELEQMYFGR